MSKTNAKNYNLPFSYKLIIISILTIAPLFQLNILLDKQLNSRFLALSITLIIGVIWGLKNTKLSILNILLAIFYLWNLSSILWARNFSESLFQAQTVLLIFSTVLVLKEILVSDKGQNIMYLAVLFSTTVLLFWGYMQLLQLPQLDLIEVYNITALNGHKNLYSSILFIKLFILLIGYIKSENKKWSLIYFITGVLSVTMILILKTRAVYLGIGVSVLIFIILNLIYNRSIFNKQVIIKTSIFILVSTATFFIITLSKPIKINRELDSKTIRLESTNERIALWKNTIDMIKEYPIKGVGAGNWQIEYPKFNSYRINRMDSENVTFQRPHNDFLWTLSELGIVGIVLLGSIYGLVLWGSFQNLKDVQTNTESKLETLILISCFVGYLSISFFDFPKERIEHIIYSHLVLVLLMLKLNQNNPWIIPKYEIKHLKFIITGLLIVNIVVGYYRIKGENHMRYAYVARGYSDWYRLIEECDKAKSIFYTVDPTSIPIDWYRGVANFTLENNSAALTDFLNAEKLNPNNANIQNNLGSAYEVNNNHEKAEQYYLQAIKLNPTFDEARLNLFVIYYNEKKYTEGLTLLKQCSPSERREQYLKLLNH